MRNIKFLWCELLIRQTPEWKKFEQATQWMEKRRQKVLRPDWDSEWLMLVERFERNVVEPLEKKWQEILKNHLNICHDKVRQ